MGEMVLKVQPMKITESVDGSILHFDIISGLAICFFIEGSSNGGGLVIEFRDAEELRKLVDEHIDRLMSNFSKYPASLLRFKLVGDANTVDHTVKQLVQRHLHVVSDYKTKGGRIEAYFYPATGRLRLNEVVPATIATTVSEVERKIRVLVVDDSKSIRMLLTNIINKDSGLEVVGAAELPSQVEGLIQQLRPDVMTLDINMPEMDGVTLVGKLIPKYRLPTIMITALSMEEGTQVLRALELGAVDYIQKPSMDKIAQMESEVVEKIKTAAKASVFQRSIVRAKPKIKTAVFALQEMPVIAIGASTGGTDAIRIILEGLPENVPPVVIVQHIPPVFSAAFAKRLNALCPFQVVEASDNMELIQGRVIVAPGGYQMSVTRTNQKIFAKVQEGDLMSGHKPSVDFLFKSVAKVCGSNAIGIILTGMGRDGAQGLLEMRNVGSRTIGQDEASCVVYGMPFAAAKIGAVERVSSLDQVADNVMSLLPLLNRSMRA